MAAACRENVLLALVMKRMSKYCKAYPLERFEEFPEWKQYARQSLLPTDEFDGGPDSQVQTPPPDFCFLHDDLSVTADVFIDDRVIYDHITEEWKTFCCDVLNFASPRETGGN